jgi:hypothetical protein
VFHTVSNPVQISSEKELARFTGKDERAEGKCAGGSKDGKGGKSG